MTERIILEKGVYVECPTQKQFEAWLTANGFEKIEEWESDSFDSWCLLMTEILVYKKGSDMWLAHKAAEAIQDMTNWTMNPVKSRRTVYNEIVAYPKE